MCLLSCWLWLYLLPTANYFRDTFSKICIGHQHRMSTIYLPWLIWLLNQERLVIDFLAKPSNSPPIGISTPNSLWPPGIFSCSAMEDSVTSEGAELEKCTAWFSSQESSYTEPWDIPLDARQRLLPQSSRVADDHRWLHFLIQSTS